MSKVGHYLQEHLLGEVMEGSDLRRYFATDASVFSVVPAIVVYPRNENDVRKCLRFTWQLAERKRLIPVTARGSGTNQSGAALGSGIILSFPAHMNRIMELDSRNGVVTVEPGINFGKMQQALQTHGRFVPSFPASLEYSTVGGAVANNSGGEKSLKYGDMRTFVKSLRVVLANGEAIETGRLSKRELNKKLGLNSFEGEIYRSVDTLLEENHDNVQKSKLNVTKNSAGYSLSSIHTKEGFDLTPLFVGSQGTLGIITEIVLETEPFNPETSLAVGMFDGIEKLQKAIMALRDMSDSPSAIEMIDENVLKLVSEINPSQLKDIIQPPYPQFVLLVEFDDDSERTQKRALKKVSKIFEKYATGHQIANNMMEQDQLWKLRHSIAVLLTHDDGRARALPVIEDGIVPLDKYADFVTGVHKIIKRNSFKAAVWGHAGDAHLHIQPFLDLSQVGDRQKIFRIMDEYYNFVIELGGSTTGEQGDGRLRAPYLNKLYGDTTYDLFKKIKHIFDPYNLLNPGVKINVSLDDIKAVMRNEYSLGSLYDHMPNM